MTESKPKFFYGYVVVAAAFLIMLMMYGAYYSFGIFFEPLLAQFGWTKAMTSGAFSLSFLLSGILGVLAGRLTDRFGPRVVLTVCGFFLGLGYVLVSQTNAFWQLYLFYGVVVALGMSSSVIPLQSTVARWFVRRRSAMNGVVISGIGVGMVVVPPLANWLISSHGWRTSYIVVGVSALVLIMAAAQFLRRDPGKMGQSPYGESEVEVRVSFPETGFSLPEAVRTWQFWTMVVALLCFTMAEGTILVHIVSHAIGLGIPAASAALIIPAIGVVSIPGRILLGMAGDRIGNKRAYVTGFAFMAVSMSLLLVAKELWMLFLFAVIFGFGYGGISVLVSPIVADLFGLRSHGVIFGVVIMFGGTAGMAIGPFLSGYIFDVTGSYHTAFLMYAIISVVGLILVSRLRPVKLGKAIANMS
jgi:MFS family permease